ncbi:hypothetical protein QJS10_CPB17g01529 [Acorus calamus]|uniref:Disease resistance N-terminal domain-containing protein n=1 Tax=Acorus calamus TaxID=4465 RepID=A0AAV9CVL7_ACOCL|nr:hypothetical protein QJS10_CPB17g01529 [Acorus calamus]
MAEAAILKVGLGVLQEIVRSGLLKEFEMISGVRQDVEKLRSNLSAIEAVLADANERRVKDRIVDDWLKKVRDVAYQVDDVLDDFRFEALRRQAEIGDHALKKVCDFFSKSNQLVFLLRLGQKLKKVRDRLDSIADERLKYHFKESTQANS